MQILTVIFAHGRESGPWGTKIRALAKVAERLGCQVISRDDRDNRDPELRVVRLIDEVKAIDGPVVLVGSSMGGYVATVASQVVRPVGLFLMAPAFGLPGYVNQAPLPISRELTVVYGWDDDIVPVEPVLDFARKHLAMLHMVPAGHALLEQVEWLTQIFELFLGRCLQLDCATARERFLATL
ncbi:MAG: alpha/beta fold hydrolase [Desulfuromonadales bacterium]